MVSRFRQFWMYLMWRPLSVTVTCGDFELNLSGCASDWGRAAYKSCIGVVCFSYKSAITSCRGLYMWPYCWDFRNVRIKRTRIGSTTIAHLVSTNIIFLQEIALLPASTTRPSLPKWESCSLLQMGNKTQTCLRKKGTKIQQRDQQNCILKIGILMLKCRWVDKVFPG